MAPRRPSGSWDRPLLSILPPDVSSGSSFDDFQRSFLTHNLNSHIKGLEFYYLQPKGAVKGHHEVSLKSDVIFDESDWRLKIDLINSTKFRFSYETIMVNRNFQFLYETQTEEKEIFIKLHFPITSRIDVGLAHNTNGYENHFQISYSW